MRYTLKSGLTIGMLVVALAMFGGCGDNDNSGENDNRGGPVRTATPAPQRTSTPAGATATPAPGPTSTPGAATQNVSFAFAAANAMQAFQVTATYPTAKGSFTGSAENVSCQVNGGGGIFTKNDNDATGKLTLSVANTSDLTFPVTVTCTFDATSTITASDISVAVDEVTQNNAPGTKTDLTVNVTVS